MPKEQPSEPVASSAQPEPISIPHQSFAPETEKQTQAASEGKGASLPAPETAKGQPKDQTDTGLSGASQAGSTGSGPTKPTEHPAESAPTNHWLQLAQQLGVELPPEMLAPPVRPAESAALPSGPKPSAISGPLPPPRVPPTAPSGRAGQDFLGSPAKGKRPGREPKPTEHRPPLAEAKPDASSRHARSERRRTKRRRTKRREKLPKQPRRPQADFTPLEPTCSTSAPPPEHPPQRPPEPSQHTKPAAQLAQSVSAPALPQNAPVSPTTVPMPDEAPETGLGLSWELARPAELNIFSPQPAPPPAAQPAKSGPETYSIAPAESSATQLPPSSPLAETEGGLETPAEQALGQPKQAEPGLLSPLAESMAEPFGAQAEPSEARQVPAAGSTLPVLLSGGVQAGPSAAGEGPGAGFGEPMPQSLPTAEIPSASLEFLPPTTPAFLEPEELLEPEDLFESAELEEEETEEPEATASGTAEAQTPARASSDQQPPIHRAVPTWKEVIDLIISANLQGRVRRSDRPPHGRSSPPRPSH